MSPADPTVPPDPSQDAVPDEPLFEHAYDGIQEYDNPMPRWWVLTFWATIVFAVVYALNVVPIIGEGKGWLGNFEDEMAAAEKKYAASRAPQEAPSDEALRALAADPAGLAAGKKVYMVNCFPCHGAAGEGGIGPNLTDDFWIHGGRPGDIHHVISAGVLDKGMPAWAAVLKPEDVTGAAAFVVSVHGTNPANAKAPQGEKVEGSP